MIEENPPLLFEPYLGMLRPANRAAQEAMPEIRGRVKVKISGGIANQKRRGLYWAVAGIVVPLLNDAHNLTLDIRDIHDITRAKLRLCDEVVLPSGEVYRKLHSTSNRAMNEADRAAFTDKALNLWSTWIGVDVATLRHEAELAA